MFLASLKDPVQIQICSTLKLKQCLLQYLGTHGIVLVLELLIVVGAGIFLVLPFLVGNTVPSNLQATALCSFQDSSQMGGIPAAISRNTLCRFLHVSVTVHAQSGAHMLQVCRGLQGSVARTLSGEITKLGFT